MFDLISIGDSTIDVFLELHEASVNCEIDPEECKLVLDYADKIPVEKLTRVAAVGNAANTAVGAARLGLRAALYTLVGDDHDGEEMRQVFVQEKVAPDYILTDKSKRSNFSVVLNFKGERTILVYHETHDYHLPALGAAKWLYVTSLGKGHQKLHQEIIEYVRTSGTKLTFQPGSHQLREGKEGLLPMIKASEVLIVNKREAEELLGGAPAEAVVLLRGLHSLGPKITVMTDGTNGSWSWDGKVIRFCGVCPETTFIERTGAGDAYSTGFVAALIHGKDIGEAMRWGSTNASSVVEHIGAREGLLTQEGIKERMAKCPLAEVKHG